MITFNYDANANPISITQTWNGQTYTWATFGWGTHTMHSSFPGVSVVGAPNGSVIPMLTQVGLHDGTRHTFEYTAAGQISVIRSFRSDNVQRAYIAYDYQTTADDCPRLSATRVWAENWTGINGVPTEVMTLYSEPGDGSHQVTAPDGTVYKEFYGGTGGSPAWQKGLLVQSETWSGGVPQKWTTLDWTQDNMALSYQSNPRVTESNVFDAAVNRRRTTIGYATFTLPSGSTCSLPSDTREYAADASSVLRRSHLEYNLASSYVDRNIVGLPAEKSLYEVNAGAETLMSKIGFAYDEAGSIQGNDQPVKHDSNYGPGFVAGRGNLSSVKRYDVVNSSQFTLNSIRYNTAGAVVATIDALGHQNLISYSDSFSDGNNSRNTLAYPTAITDADGFSSLVQYNFDFGAQTRLQGPPPANQPQGLIQILAYDGAARLERVTTTNNGAYQRYVYGPNYVQSFATVNNIADEAYSIQAFDGLGRINGTAKNHPGSAGGYSAQHTVYDLVGRTTKQSNPTEITGSWVPSGDEAYNAQTGEGGWRYTEQTYDWQGRPLVTTNADGSTTKEASYSGCGCAGGEVVTLTDEGTISGGVAKKRQQKIYADVLGRTVKTEVLNWQGGSVYSTSVNTFNARDQLTNLKQYQGPDSSGVFQETIITYDGYGRLKTRHLPHQQVDQNNSSSTGHTTWNYHADDTIQNVTDARGASKTFSYNARRLVTGIGYAAPAVAPAIPVPGPVAFEYDGAGNRSLMTDDSGRVDYLYDSLSRLQSETRQFSGLSETFTLSYEYSPSGDVKKVTDQTAGTSLSSIMDNSGRVSGVSTVGHGGVVTQFASQLAYRASGALKSVTYGNNTILSLGYGSRGLVSNYQLSGVTAPGSIPVPVASAYQYYADGGIKFAQEQPASTSIRDRAYEHDHVGRLKEAYSGTEARDYVNNTNLGISDGPYRQSSNYDAWNNVLSGGGRFWSRTVIDTDSYNQFNRNPEWTYDAEGNVMSRNESFGDSTPSQNRYDASGLRTSVTQMRACMVEPQHMSRFDVYTNTQTYDGDGQVTRYEQVHTHNLNGPHAPGSPTKTYYLRSSVLGGRVISEYDASGGQPEWSKTYVYAGSERIGSMSRYGASSSRNSWRVVDPVTGDEIITVETGEMTAQTTFDPNGVDVGLEDPFPPPGEDEGTCVTYDPNYVDNRPQAPRLNPLGGSANCVIDNIEQACNSVSSDAVMQCPDNDCGPRGIYETGSGRFVGVLPLTVNRETGRFQVSGIVDQYTRFGNRFTDPSDGTVIDSSPGKLKKIGTRELTMTLDNSNFSGIGRMFGPLVTQQNPYDRANQVPLTDEQIRSLRSDTDREINARKDCMEFISTTLLNAAKNTQRALYSTDFLSDPIKIFDAVASRPGSIVVAPGLKYGGQATGTLGGGNAGILYPSFHPGMGLEGLAEILHHAGADKYSDQELAWAGYEAAFSQGYNVPPPPNTSNYYANSMYFHNTLQFRACRPNQQKR